jgi:hypothetical protein
MNKQGKVMTEILVMLVVVVITSAVILLLVQSGVLEVKAENEQVSVLNANFIPVAREGYLAIKDFRFCNFVDLDYNCIGEVNSFALDSEIHFVFTVESSTFNGDIMLVENYRIKGPTGEMLLEVDVSNNFNFDLSSNKETEDVTFKDFFIVNQGLPEGEYTLELLIENPLLTKKTTLVKKFSVSYIEDFSEEYYEEDYEDNYYDTES